MSSPIDLVQMFNTNKCSFAHDKIVARALNGQRTATIDVCDSVDLPVLIRYLESTFKNLTTTVDHDTYNGYYNIEASWK